MKIIENGNRELLFGADFYLFREYINDPAFVNNIDKNDIIFHSYAIKDLYAMGINTVYELLVVSTMNLSTAMRKAISKNRYYLSKAQYYPIPIRADLLYDLSTQYVNIHAVNSLSNRTTYLPQICKCIGHNTTKFYTNVILYYMFNRLYKKDIKNYRRRCKRKDITFSNDVMIAILYNKLIGFCSSFDNIETLQSFKI